MCVSIDFVVDKNERKAIDCRGTLDPSEETHVAPSASAAVLLSEGCSVGCVQLNISTANPSLHGHQDELVQKKCFHTFWLN